jgi:hypothetical protein
MAASLVAAEETQRARSREQQEHGDQDQRDDLDYQCASGQLSLSRGFYLKTAIEGSGDGHPFAQFACDPARMTPQRRIALPIASSRIDECVCQKLGPVRCRGRHVPESAQLRTGPDHP